MPATVELHTPFDAMVSPTVTLFEDLSDTALIAGTALTEATNRPGVYTFSTTLAGRHLIAIYESLTFVGWQWADIPPSGTVVASEERNGVADQIIIESGITPGAGLTNDTGTQLTRITLAQAISLCVSGIAAILAGAAGTNVTIKPAGKPSGNTRIDATVDASGNRSAITLKVPD